MTQKLQPLNPAERDIFMDKDHNHHRHVQISIQSVWTSIIVHWAKIVCKFDRCK